MVLGYREHSRQISVAVDTKKNSIIVAPVGRRPTARGVVPLSSGAPSDNVGGLFPGLYQASNPFKWSQCNRTVSTGMSAPLRRREEEITAGYLLVTTVTNASRPGDYPSSPPD